jgi:uroporphyrinogen decarboxylase
MAHSAGILVEFHCCGSQPNLIPEFLDLGVDILTPLQTSAKDMTPHKLKEEFGGYISFSGGVDVQTILPHGTPESVRDYVFYLLDTVGKGGGYILQPSHAIQVDTPPENVIAMVDALYEYYGMPATGL